MAHSMLSIPDIVNIALVSVLKYISHPPVGMLRRVYLVIL